MKLPCLASCLFLPIITGAFATTPDPLSYRSLSGSYVPPKSPNVTTLLEFINSRSDLSVLADELQTIGGFPMAFDTEPSWSFTFFAPNNDAFALHTGTYFNEFKSTPKGKWWLGNTLLSHYVPNTNLNSSSFNETYQRFQTASYLYVGSQVQDGAIILNDVATVVEKDISVTKASLSWFGFAPFRFDALTVLQREQSTSLIAFSTLQPRFSKRTCQKSLRVSFLEVVRIRICHIADG
ncbi:hypothetical protein ASPACDRAFT_47505 [Aspergillus aculeatus ATCC 16872]|uniref:FAS1 domain-containing protein n=1 Tax=Aspergillus aculeatus (strain ATCC 16872 / CBS 172.66 / WB 5094) TaxID=690307 RepID=A0A1L9WHM3_ASPA1|nr:uncharacterized protein ASPACDRAFT_47505 [Aspergillus aculeatus ATCC 16872]OJJ95615.1 hypothetical protein ASPACDRAFT_47505 [Aspergillus aculeatus ATCC 16872]